MTSPKEIPVSVFKAKCLAIVEVVSSSKVPVTETKRGKPIAKLLSVNEEVVDLKGSVRFKSDEDLFSTGKVWEAEGCQHTEKPASRGYTLRCLYNCADCLVAAERRPTNEARLIDSKAFELGEGNGSIG